MSRQLTAFAQSQQQATINTEAYLMRMLLEDVTVYTTNILIDLSWASKTWTNSGFSISDITQTPGMGVEKMTVQAPRGESNTVYGYIKQGLHIGRQIDIWLVYIDRSTQQISDGDEPIRLISGRGDAGGVNQNSAFFTIYPGTSLKYGYSPSRFMDSESGFNHLPQERQKILWLGEVTTLVSQSDL